MDQFEKYLQFQKEFAQATLKIVEQFQQPSGDSAKKRTSNIDIVQDVLRNADQPLHVSEIISRAEQDHGVELSRDSIVSALLKKVSAGKGIVRTAPNTFALVKEEP